MEWPPGSGRVETFPEIDRVEWFKLKRARRKLKAAQVPFLDRLQAVIARQQREAQEATVGRVVAVLFEKPGRMPGQMSGKSEHLMAVSVTGPDDLRGRIVPVRVTAALTNSLAGELA